MSEKDCQPGATGQPAERRCMLSVMTDSWIKFFSPLQTYETEWHQTQQGLMIHISHSE